jgi:uncharacterized protein YndB with AHSA1/START domain
MHRIIQQTVILPGPAERLFDMYLDPEIHGDITGAPASISMETGSEFRAFKDMIFGKILHAVPKRLIVQAWRAAHWKPEDLDSTLILTFWPEGGNGRIELVHVNVPDHDYNGVNEGWEKYYWKPWRDYLSKP